MPYVWFVVVCFIWGSSFILMKRAMLCLSPVSIGAWRDFGGALVLALIFLVARHKFSLRRADLQAINRQAWADVVGEVHAAFHRRREVLVHERVQALTHRTTTRGLLPEDLVPSWAK